MGGTSPEEASPPRQDPSKRRVNICTDTLTADDPPPASPHHQQQRKGSAVPGEALPKDGGSDVFGTYHPNLPSNSSASSAAVAIRRLTSTGTSGLRSAVGMARRDSQSGARDTPAARAPGGRSWRSGRAGLMLAAFLLLVLIVASLVGWFITYSAGVRSVETIGERLQEHYPPKVMKEVQLRMEPARVHLQQGLELLHLKGLDPTTWEAYDVIRDHGVSFLLNYFDDAQCCYGFFTRMSYTPGVNEDNFGDDRALFDAVIASREAGPEPNTTVTSLAELRPSDTLGNATNEAYWVPFNMTDRKLPRPLVMSDYSNLGFVHFPRDDGVNPKNPRSGWWRVINERDMQEGDFCFSPIFVWNINEPVTLKIHGIVPVWGPPVGRGIGSADAKERVGAYVVGFKLHFLSKFLHDTAEEMLGAKTFIVERNTGFIIASDNITMPLMSSNQETIHTNNVSDSAVRELATLIAPDCNWTAVPDSEHYTADVNGVATMIFLDSYRQYCLDWVVVVAVPRDTVLEGISSHRVSTVVASVSAPIAMVTTIVILIIAMPYLIRHFKRAKSQQVRKNGPPRRGDKVTLLTTDIQGSTKLWDEFPEELAKDIAIHHECLRAELKNFNGYEILTEGDAMHIAFHTPEDAICFAIQVQFNLLCAPWTPALEEGLDAKLLKEGSWANLNMPMMEQFHSSIIRDLPFNGALASTENATKHSVSSPLFSVQDAADTQLSKKACSESPGMTVTHTSSSRPLPIFRGLRVRMAIHSGVADDTSSRYTDRRTRYGGQFMEVSKALSDMPCGGQIVMTADTLAAIESMHELLLRVDRQCTGWRSGLPPSKPPSSKQASKQGDEQAAMSMLHLGSHVLVKPASQAPSQAESSVPAGPPVDDPSTDSAPSQDALPEAAKLLEQPRLTEFSQGTAAAGVLMEELRGAIDVYQVVPWPLRARTIYFPPLNSKKEVTPAWYASPGSKDVTILFTFIENWALLKRWERNLTWEAGILAHSLEQHDSLVRALLLENNGYEVEGEDGCFVCAFQQAIDAIEFSAALQEGLLHMQWHPELLITPWACEQRTSAGQLLNRGLRVAVGMCTGNARRYQPCLRTGRMEYFGPIMNHAARVAVAAHGGQILVHSNCLSITATNPQLLDLVPASIRSMGKHKLKGISSEVHIYQVCPHQLEGRIFPPIKTSTTMLMQQDDNADSIFRYGLDHTWPSSGRTPGAQSIDDSGSLREYERFARKLMSGASSATGHSDCEQMRQTLPI